VQTGSPFLHPPPCANDKTLLHPENNNHFIITICIIIDMITLHPSNEHVLHSLSETSIATFIEHTYAKNINYKYNKTFLWNKDT
jgi:hypothetical protein